MSAMSAPRTAPLGDLLRLRLPDLLDDLLFPLVLVEPLLLVGRPLRRLGQFVHLLGLGVDHAHADDVHELVPVLRELVHTHGHDLRRRRDAGVARHAHDQGRHVVDDAHEPVLDVVRDVPELHERHAEVLGPGPRPPGRGVEDLHAGVERVRRRIGGLHPGRQLVGRLAERRHPGVERGGPDRPAVEIRLELPDLGSDRVEWSSLPELTSRSA
jgi:hypothetical protein